jgi:hypothetical protein
MINVKAKIEKSIRQRGLRATVRMSLYNLYYYGRKLTPGYLYSAYKEREFDRMYGVDTSGRIDLSDLGDVDGVAADLGTRYEAIAPDAFHEMMEMVGEAGVDLTGLTFIDYGSGKGRAVLLASHYPFRRIIGVEISKTLNEVAMANVAKYAAPDRACTEILLEQQDALVWRPPNEASLFYFYHPFEPPLLAQVLERIRESVTAEPRKAWVVYIGADVDVLEAAPFLHPIDVSDEHPKHGFYECRPSP